MNYSPRTMRGVRAVLPATIAAAIVLLTGCDSNSPTQPPSITSNPVSKYSAEVPVAWDELQMALVQHTSGYSPPVAARAFGYSGVALYEALVPGMPDHRSLVGQVNELTSVPQPQADMTYHWPSVANSVLASISRRYFVDSVNTASNQPTDEATANARMIDSLETLYASQFRNEAGIDTAMLNRSIVYGKQVADAIYEWSKNDGGDRGYIRNFPTTYTPPTGPGLWVSTPRPGGLPPQRALQPYWGQNRPFVLAKGNPNATSDPGAPLAYSKDPSSDFYKEGLEVYNTVKNLTPEQKAIALYWSDDPGTTCTPPGHSVSILCQCLLQASSKLDFAAVSFAKVGIAVNDAFIACWEAKYRYNLLRPITYIQQTIDSTWNTPLVTDPLGTPPFPEYTSGHSVQSGAASAVLTSLFGSNFAFTDHTHEVAGKGVRSFASFDAFAQEAAISRLYGGIHYRAAIDRGVEQGKKVGAQVNALKFMK